MLRSLNFKLGYVLSRRLLCSLRIPVHSLRLQSSSTDVTDNIENVAESEEPLWKDPFKHALPKEGSFVRF